MNSEEWGMETRRRLDTCCDLFKPKELMVILDFIRTAEDDSYVEAK